MPFKDSPGLRRIALAAIEARDVVQVRLRPGCSFRDMDGVLHREGKTMLLPRRTADDFIRSGIVDLVD